MLTRPRRSGLFVFVVFATSKQTWKWGLWGGQGEGSLQHKFLGDLRGAGRHDTSLPRA